MEIRPGAIMIPTKPLQRPIRLVFFGTPEFAAVCLEHILHSTHEVCGVVTAPDRKAGRGHRLQSSAVKELALEKSLPLLQPTNLKDDAFAESLQAWDADVFIVVAFRMLPERVWNAPTFGTINLHASLLPNLRGAAPIQWAIMHGLEETGVTTFSLQHAIDTGDILQQAKVSITQADTASSLHDKLLMRGKELIVETLDGLCEGRLKRLPQHEIPLAERRLDAPKLNRENTRIDWTQSVDIVKDKIRGLSPYPKAWTTTPFGEMKIVSAAVVNDIQFKGANPGTAIRHHQNLLLACRNGWIQIGSLIPEGKKPMEASAWLNGLNDEPGVWGQTS